MVMLSRAGEFLSDQDAPHMEFSVMSDQLAFIGGRFVDVTRVPVGWMLK